MKSKKSLRIIAVLAGIVSVFTAFGFASAAADGETPGETPAVTKEYIAVTAAQELVATPVPFDYVSVKAAEDSEPQTAVAGDIDNVKVYVGEVDVSALPEDTTAYTTWWNSSDNTIEYRNSTSIIAAGEGKYTVLTTMKDADKNGKTEFTTVVTVYSEGSDLSYVTAADRITEAQNKINELTVSDGSLALPFEEISALIESGFTDKKILTYNLYYSAPNSSSYSSASSSNNKGKITDLSVSTKGTYRFYVLVKDGRGKEISLEDCEENEYNGIRGWYRKDTDELVVPVFTYENKENKEITITAKGDSGTGRVNQRYQNLSITVENASDTLVKLQYNATSGDKEADGWVDATAGKEARFNQDNFKSGTYYFTPLKKGYFRLSVTAKGGEDGITISEMKTDAVSVQDKVEELELVDERVKNFFKNNWLSLIFLGIAVLCLIGIIVVALWKPADKNGKKKAAKNEKTETAEVKDVSDEAVEVVEAEEPAEEAEQPQEGVAEETTEATEETAEPDVAAETEAAEATEAAEETPAENKGE